MVQGIFRAHKTNGNAVFPAGSEDHIAPEDPDFIDLLSTNGSSWQTRSTAYETFIYFQVFMTDRTSWGRKMRHRNPHNLGTSHLHQHNLLEFLSQYQSSDR